MQSYSTVTRSGCFIIARNERIFHLQHNLIVGHQTQDSASTAAELNPFGPRFLLGIFMQSNTHFWARGGYLIILPIPSRKQTASSQQPRH